ncbi:MAG TPA: rhodanese-like domain-containing protein [Solirubrobacteraceae bacterium]|nr:rhodanese-like domain-containing protein [Solirubrobacteraceae bacterium]
MLFQQVLYRDLGCASYVLGDGGKAVVVDPRFDIDVYLELARDNNVEITHVIDTHDHADHMSGRVRLAERTGAIAHRPARSEDPNRNDIEPGQELFVGNLRLGALATPGHRPEHIAIVVSDESRSPDPWLVLTGDSLLVGDLARPDLAVEPELGSRELHSSVLGLLELGDHVEVWPGHVGGSLCGGTGLSAKTSSTVGYEARTNPLLKLDEDSFVDRLMAGIPVRPPNIAHIVEGNRATFRREPERPHFLSSQELADVLRDDASVLDVREPGAFDAGHIAGAINLPAMTQAIGTRAGWAVRPEEALVIAADDERVAWATAGALHAVGLWRIVGIALDWDGLAIVSERSWSLQRLARAIREDAVDLFDVRDANEWRCGHVDGSRHLPLAKLGSGRRLDLDLTGAPVAVACAAGARAAFAASLLRRGGIRDVVRVSGGGIGNLPTHGVRLVGGVA